MTRPFWIKICGPTSVENAVMLAECGVDAVGLNFYQKSSRFISDETAASIVASLRGGVELVGLFVDRSQAAMTTTARAVGLEALQTYDFAPESTLAPFSHLAAFRVKDVADLDAIRAYVAAHRPQRVLVDSFVAGSMGGTGVAAPWELLAGFDPGVPWILAGGLTPENVAEAIRIARPHGVDVAGGVESRPGVKDWRLVTAFVAAARNAGAEIGGSPRPGP